MVGYAIFATDGSLGTVSDLLFDDSSRTIRWIVVNAGRPVLIHPSAVAQCVHDQEQLLLTLDRAQILASPELEADAPVSFQMEERLHEYYGWDPAVGGLTMGQNPIALPLSPPPLFGGTLPPEAALTDTPRYEGDPHLRSLNAVIGYHVEAADGQAGHLVDFLVDDRRWDVHALVIDTRKWWIGAHAYVLVSPITLKSFDWSDHSIAIGLTQAQLRASFPWEPGQPFTARQRIGARHPVPEG